MSSVSFETVTVTVKGFVTMPESSSPDYAESKQMIATKLEGNTVPAEWYIYLWRHGEIDRYAGRGKGLRWKAHASPKVSDSNQRKADYFRKYLTEMTCFLIAEGLDRDRGGRSRDPGNSSQRLRNLRHWDAAQ
jgi:hypothetical protein